jgi:phage baseplate assembly protein W
MTAREALFGSDLRLLGNLTRQNDRDRGSDLFTTPRPPTGEIDLETLQGVENLQQALLLRFLTPTGELAALGHPDYGSRLYELIGQLNTETNRNQVKMFTLLALAQEPRIKQVLELNVTQSRADRTMVEVETVLRAIDSPTPLNLVFGFSFEGGVAA